MVYLLAIAALLFLALIAILIADGLRAISRRAKWANQARPLQLRVVERIDIDDCLMQIRFKTKWFWQRLPVCLPGQYVQLVAPAESGGRSVSRAYSLSAWAASPKFYELGIKREQNGSMTQWLWSNLRVGDVMQVGRPRGHFVLNAGQGTLVLIGGGIGITPMRAMVHASLRSGRRVQLFHSARTVDQLLYQDEFLALSASSPQFSYHPYLSQPRSDWTGGRGRMTAEHLMALMQRPESADIYMCASAQMMSDLRSGFLRSGVDDVRLHQEAFGAEQNTDSQSYSVLVQPSGAELTFQGQPSLLALLQQAGVAIESDCRNGTCGACRIHCASGSVRQVLVPECEVNEGQLLACCCVPSSALVVRLNAA